uniref:Genome polyprotein n=1 Tax=Pernambuco nodavirus TaxID=2565391 RepID=A0A4P8JH61_9VIRU|nr:RNA-depedent RNA polymerase [Pernambuco nodavirus]
MVFESVFRLLPTHPATGRRMDVELQHYVYEVVLPAYDFFATVLAKILLVFITFCLWLTVVLTFMFGPILGVGVLGLSLAYPTWPLWHFFIFAIWLFYVGPFTFIFDKSKAWFAKMEAAAAAGALRSLVSFRVLEPFVRRYLLSAGVEDPDVVEWFSEKVAALAVRTNRLGTGKATKYADMLFRLWGFWLYLSFVFKWSVRATRVAFIVICLIATLPLEDAPRVLLSLPRFAYWAIAKVDKFFASEHMGFSDFRQLVSLQIMVFCVNILTLADEVGFLAQKYSGDSNESRKNRRVRFRATLTQTLLRFGRVVDSVSLPSVIRNAPLRWDLPSIREGLDVARDLGWPINVDITEPVTGIAGGVYDRKWLFFGTDFRTGMNLARTYVDSSLDELRRQSPVFRRTEEYATLDNELHSTARYFMTPEVSLPDLDVSELWVLLGDIFKHSQLTPFKVIIRAWEKKYALGSFMRDPSRKKRKYKRSHFIRDFGGYRAFSKLWADTFRVAPSIPTVSAVFVKGEALPERKWANDKVRTVIGSSIFHYISSTVWNYEPNHRFRWETTPIKIGLPLNGGVLSGIYERHAKYDKHFAGDMTAFDSTIVLKMQDVVKRVRKKGFEHHRDYQKICGLIDSCYKNLDSSFLNTTTTGNVYRKGTGLTTGHSSTSMDNSIVTTSVYLMAWKEITGLSANEFRFFNELSCFGDDHILSMLNTAPAAWNWSNITEVMSKWNIDMRLEAEGKLSAIPFLGKFCRAPLPADFKLFKEIGLSTPSWVIYHEKDRLLGKLTARVLNGAPEYRVKRLISYLSLTAHHEDVYSQITEAIRKIKVASPGSRAALERMHIPSYHEVVKQWYDYRTNIPKDTPVSDIIESSKDEVLTTYGEVGPLDVLASALSTVPDILNPAIFNVGYSHYLQRRCKEWVDWPLILLQRVNGTLSQAHLSAIARKTCYDWLTNLEQPFQTPVSTGGLLLRHWLYVTFESRSGGGFAPRWFTALSKKFADLGFCFNAQVQQEIIRTEFPIWNFLLTLLLNFVPDVPHLGILASVKVPNLSLIWDYITGLIITQVWQLVPPNFKDLAPLANAQWIGKRHLVIAPTGTGKSTDLIAWAQMTLGPKFGKLILVEPRSALVKALTPWLVEAKGVHASGLTSGMVLDKTCKVWVMTPQELFLNPQWISPDNLIIIDEAHVTEPFYELLKTVVQTLKVPTMALTASPTNALRAWRTTETELRIAKLWSIDEYTHTLSLTSQSLFRKSYDNKVLEIVSSASRRSRYLIFVPDLSHVASLAALLPGKTCTLTSRSADIDPNAKFYISTSVADVGLTIPNVDVVVTPNIDRAITISDDGKTLPLLVKLTEAQILQRRGRTGRTNNGAFHLVNFSGDFGESILNRPDPKLVELLTEWLSVGVKPGTVAKFRPDLFLAVAGWRGSGGEYGSVLDRKTADEIVDNMARILDSVVGPTLHGAGSRLFSSSLQTADGSETLPIEISSTGRMFTFNLPDVWANVATSINGAIGQIWQNHPNLTPDKQGNDVPAFDPGKIFNLLTQRALNDTIVLGAYDSDEDEDPAEVNQEAFVVDSDLSF